ncbi:MAG: PKD domain-containing protein [Candidatus Taylorbacteria bacterium]|nr:PKD domain-containing protein [Candidatus Taylorbacteria bacterium]
MFTRNSIFIIFIASFFIGRAVNAQMVLDEIMYDLPGTDTGREWVEVLNTGNSSVEISTTTWKFFEADTNHSLSLFRGDLLIPPSSYFVIVDDPQKFLLDWPSFNGTIFDSTFSLSNTGEIIALKNDSITVVDQVNYTSSEGANGDGNSLQKNGSIWKPVSPTPGQPSSGVSGTAVNQNQPPLSSSGTTTAENSLNESPVSTQISSESIKSSWPVEPRIISRIISPITAIAGADVVFKGEALGLDKKPIENPRFLWNFGDGATKEGETVMHAYNFPADYVVILDVSSGKYDTSARANVKVVPASISIGNVIGGVDGKIEVVNSSNQELDLSWWRIESGGRFFSLPKNTKILAKRNLPLSANVLGFSINENDLAILYPNGVLEYRFKNVQEVLATDTVSKKPLVDSAEVEQKSESSFVRTVEINLKKDLKKPSVVKPSSQFAATVSSTDFPIKTVQSEMETPASPRSPFWLYSTVGVIILGLGFALMSKVGSTEVKSKVDEYEIIEE